jgi:hypothetical protein
MAEVRAWPRCARADEFFTTTNLHGWVLCADGAYVAVVRIRSITESATGSGLPVLAAGPRKRRIERRVRRK